MTIDPVAWELIEPDGSRRIFPVMSEENVADWRAHDCIVNPLYRAAPAHTARGGEDVWPAEREVGKAAYERLESIMGASPGSREFAELRYLSEFIESVEEVGSFDGPRHAAVTADVWPDGRFSVHDPDPSDDHGVIYLVCPGGLMVNTSCDCTPGVDARRTQWMADVLNAALQSAPAPSGEAV